MCFLKLFRTVTVIQHFISELLTGQVRNTAICHIETMVVSDSAWNAPALPGSLRRSPHYCPPSFLQVSHTHWQALPDIYPKGSPACPLSLPFPHNMKNIWHCIFGWQLHAQMYMIWRYCPCCYTYMFVFAQFLYDLYNIFFHCSIHSLSTIFGNKNYVILVFPLCMW